MSHTTKIFEGDLTEKPEITTRDLAQSRIYRTNFPMDQKFCTTNESDLFILKEFPYNQSSQEEIKSWKKLSWQPKVNYGNIDQFS